ncbi:hypothetical protein HDU76_011559 [Blyttiomyces sp. JEL0837]|nr:hypothetical protein HDU76_011559 [Blyttiomyces sp. JEL0837]
MVSGLGIDGTTIPARKYRTNFTLVLFQPYAVGSFYSWVSQRDAQVELAVQEINQDPAILPDTYVNLVRANGWDPDTGRMDYNTMDSGGYAIASAFNVSQSNVNAVVGGYYSKTAIFSVEVYSYYQIPFCGSDLTSPTLSDKNRYPYFFRMGTGDGFGDYIAQLLQYWKVTRVALVVGFDAWSVAGGLDAMTSFKRFGIQIITKIAISRDSYMRHDYTQNYRTLKQLDARVLPSGTLTLDEDNPVPDEGDIITKYGPDAKDAIQGFILITSNPQSLDSPVVQKWNKTWAALMNESPRYQSIYNSFTNTYVGLYDCTKTMLIGVHKFLQSHPQYTPEMLVNNSIRSLLLPGVFAHTGYEGLTANPIELDKMGDLNAPQLFISMNYSLSIHDLPWDESTGFAKTDAFGTKLIPLSNLATLYGAAATNYTSDLSQAQIFHRTAQLIER